MRKIYIAILSSFIFSLFATVLNAQVNTYVFAPSSGTYTALTGTTTSTATGDDGTQNVAIGFNFDLGGVTYTNAIISTNGAIKLAANGTTTFGTSWTNALGNAYGAAIIAPLWDDNNASGGSVVYVTEGTAPNRTFSVEWRNIHLGGGGDGGSPTGTFKVTLTETTNSVAISYGTINTLTASTASIGLNDLVSFISVTPTATPTASSTTANNSISSAANLTSGTTYTFTPPPPCIPGSLNGGTTETTTTTACASSSFTLSVTGASLGAGLTYQWESSSDNTSWSPVGGATGQTYVVTQTTPTYYRRRMTCSGVDAFSSSIQILQNPPSACYCPVAYDFDTEPITLVNFANINNASSATINGSPDQEDFTSIVGNVLKGQTYTITVKGNTAGNFTTHINVFIDWNQDGDFADAGEGFYLGTIINSTGLDAVQVTGIILIPPSALDGNTRMRVIKKFNTQPTACNTTGFGQAEDYTLNITTPLCIAPSGISVGSITTTGASVSFTVTGTAYVEYGPPGFTPGTGATAGGGTVVSGSSPVAISGLPANTLYDIYVRQDCGGGVFSGNANGGNFRTLCNTIATFPYTETFETSSVSRACWIPTQVSGTTNWTYGAGAGNGGTITTAHGGTVNARHFGSGSGSVAKLVSPAFNFSGLNPALGAQLTFWYANQNWLGDQNELRVYYKTSAAGTWTLIPGAVYTTNVGQWTEVELLLPSSTSSDYYIAFEGTEDFGFGVAIDDVTVAAAPSCPKPTGVSAIGTSPTTISVDFTSPGVAFIVEWGPVGFTPGAGATAGAGGTAQLIPPTPLPYEITGLNPATAYDVYVRRVCDPGVDYSVNVKATARTLCDAVNIPYLQTFESAVQPDGLPTCTSMQDVNGNSGPDANETGGRWSFYASTDPNFYVSPTTRAQYLYDAVNSARPADDWLYMQGLNLTGGTTYRLKFYYKGSDGPTWIERLEVKYGTKAVNTSMTNTLFTNNNIATAGTSPWDSARVDFTPATTGVYYIGFHAMSLADQAFLLLEDVSVRVAPVVDLGVTTLTGIPTCPAANGVLHATITNHNLTDQNFATYPVTVTATITGAATSTLTTTINTGTLAAGASMDVPFPTFNYAGPGVYNVTINAGSPNDSETGNDLYTTSFFVNASPTAAVVAAKSICEGAPAVQLTSQFTTPPAAPVTMPAVTSGTLSVAVPDDSPVGSTHTLSVTGVPAGASIVSMSVNINLTHTWVNDMVLNLRAPNGRIINLFNRDGGLFQANITNMTISSTATTPIPVTGAPFTGTYAPDAASGVGPDGLLPNTASFTDLFGLANGDWTLGMRDYFAGDLGTLKSWSITITYATVYPNVTWSPLTGLFTNSAATLGYFGENAYSVYAKPTATTTYTVKSTNPTTGCVSTSTVLVTVNPKPVVNLGNLPSRICVSDTLVPLSATPAGGTWSGIGVSGSNFVPPLTAVGTFNVSYTYTDALSCSSVTTIPVKVESCPERVILLRDDAVILYPNPTDGRFNIRINSVLYNKLTMRVYNSSGSLVRTQQYDGLVFNRLINIDLTYLPSGPYMVQFSYDGGVRTSEKAFKVMIAR